MTRTSLSLTQNPTAPGKAHVGSPIEIGIDQNLEMVVQVLTHVSAKLSGNDL
jgi:hypothetical protein